MKFIPLALVALATVLVCMLVLPARADPQPPLTPSRSYEPPTAYSVVRVEAEHSAGANLIMRAYVDWTKKGGQTDLNLVEPWADAMGDVCMSRRECVELAAVAFEESRFADWVLDQSCNSAAWRIAHQMHRVCDSGRAYGPLQVQDSRFAGASPEFQSSVGLEMLRRHPQAWTTWGKARALAERWLRANP